jgi:hypothetical protein
MRFRLRTLLVLFLFGPPLVFGCWRAWQWIDAERRRGIEFIEMRRVIIPGPPAGRSDIP